MTTKPELKGPIRNARFIHRAILKEAQDIQDAVVALTTDDMNGANNLSQRFAAFERILKFHEDSEDLSIFPALQSKYPYIADTYEFDHHRHRDHSSALTSTLAELGTSANVSGRRELLKLLGDQAVAFNAFMGLHIDKEDILLFPAYDEMFSPEEQMAHSQATQGHVEPEAMAAASGWMFQRLDAVDRESFLRGMKAMLPPEPFAGLSKGLAADVPASDWQEVVRRFPELA